MILPLQTLYFEDLSLGMTESLTKVVSSDDVVGFAEITGDRNPIHLSEHFAAKTPFGTRIAHGLYTAGLISALLGTRLPGPGAVYISQSLHFRAPVKIGDGAIVAAGSTVVRDVDGDALAIGRSAQVDKPGRAPALRRHLSRGTPAQLPADPKRKKAHS